MNLYLAEAWPNKVWRRDKKEKSSQEATPAAPLRPHDLSIAARSNDDLVDLAAALRKESQKDPHHEQPRETMQANIEKWTIPEANIHERLLLLSEASKQAICKARANYKGMGDILNEPFIKVLEQKLFYTTPYSLDILRQISESIFAGRITTLSFCGLQFATDAKTPSHWYNGLFTKEDKQDLKKKDWKECRLRGQEQAKLQNTVQYVEDLRTVLAKFTNLKHIRYFPTSPDRVGGGWVNMRVLNIDKYWIGSSIGETSRVMWVRDDNYLYSTRNGDLKDLFAALHGAGTKLESFTTPSFGNQAGWETIGEGRLEVVDLKHFAIVFQDLKELRLNLRSSDCLNRGHDMRKILRECPRLEILELSFFADDDSEDPEIFRPLNVGGVGLGAVPLPHLQELRLAFDAGIRTAKENILELLKSPGAGLRSVRKLGLAYITLDGDDWDELLLELSTLLKLEDLWLISPRKGWCPKSSEAMKFSNEFLGGVARKVQIHHDEQPFVAKKDWVKQNQRVHYKSFAIFD
ncbi:hypothetical protein BU16DRAFT_543485 [Lophium mytilinum]|uniref:RNI-like protein n=1 Tax=Lophium mytilinum TaxID=390894 RepID=A0A6A6QGY2_9PEZI|nr:hypothetical protein BU16DRAFT_543485 [Lophium mytilinum]